MGMLVVSSLINSFGTEVVATFGMASRLDQFAIMPSQSISMATSTIAGQNIGAGKDDNVRETVKWATILAVGISALLTLVMQVAPQTVLRLFTTDSVLLSRAGGALRILSLSYVFSAVMFVTNGFLRGAGDTMATMVFSITSLWLIRLTAGKASVKCGWVRRQRHMDGDSYKFRYKYADEQGVLCLRKVEE